ncbi:hypothetical protein FA95DRAFT_1532519 [Auriscalpium vulgare]|uniref:Uncharacterized protein n=1 Tax=Auriscalpium vulgare TaxID=40419 RepID=A0ACB8S9T3_9AGAM|nr:hypothetical protein FA95DRAFT_1532519 [Auriscalpium vulgare]
MSIRSHTAQAQACQPVRDAGAPFNDVDPIHAVILRSSDNVDFFVLKLFLARASSFFSGMFELPDPHTVASIDDEDHRQGVAIVRMQESSHALDVLLRMCYPVDNPDLSDLQDVRLALECCHKYVIECFEGTLKAALLRAADARPLAVYALACRYRFEDVANDAAKRLLFKPFRSHSEADLFDLTGVQYQRILQYHRNCSLKATTEPPVTWFNALVAGSTTSSSSPTTSQSCRTQFHFFYAATQPSKSFWVPHWWTAYLHKALEAVKDRPRGSTVTAPELLEPFNKLALQCAECMEESVIALHKLSTALALEVEKAVNQVS